MALSDPKDTDYVLWGGWVVATAASWISVSDGHWLTSLLVGSDNIRAYVIERTAQTTCWYAGYFLVALAQVALLRWRFQGFPARMWGIVAILGVLSGPSGATLCRSASAMFTMDSLLTESGSGVLRAVENIGFQLAVLGAATVQAFLLVPIFKRPYVWLWIAMLHSAIALIIGFLHAFRFLPESTWIAFSSHVVFGVIEGFWLSTATLTGLDLDAPQTPS